MNNFYGLTGLWCWTYLLLLRVTVNFSIGGKLHQILGLRPTQVFEQQNLWFPDIPTLFDDIDEIISEVTAKLGEKELYNLYFTANHSVTNAPPRSFESCDTYYFDIDDIDPLKKEETARSVCGSLGVDYDATGVVFSGHGLQLWIHTGEHERSTSFHHGTKLHYKAACELINTDLQTRGLPGKADSSVWECRRVMRLPNTENRKKDKPMARAHILQQTIEKQEFTLSKFDTTPIEKIAPSEALSTKGVLPIPKDKKAIIEGCVALKYAMENQETLSEPEWMNVTVGVGAFIGREFVHKYSCKHPNYSKEETDAKINHWVSRAGPSTCSNVNIHSGGKCAKCVYSGKVKSPINITSPNFISTEHTGFHTQKIDNNGVPKPARPCYSDLFQFWARTFNHVTHAVSGEVFVFDETHWRSYSKVEAYAFATKHFNPEASKHMCEEFWNRIKSMNLQPMEFFDVDRKMNFLNGVLDLRSNKFEPDHDKHFFRSTLPYNYDPEADCPRFREFLKQVTCGRQDLADVIMEFIGYGVSGCFPKFEKAMLMVGTGANGKSTLMDTIRDLVGRNCSALLMSDLRSETDRYTMVGRAFNIAEETPRDGMREAAMLKNIISGGDVKVRKMYHQAYNSILTTKLMFACNELPTTADKSHGVLRKMLIVPFDRRFEGKEKDLDIRDKLKEELPGIMNMALDAYRRLTKNRHFTNSESIDAMARDYQLMNDSSAMWMDDNVRVYDTGTDFDKIWVTKTNMYAHYKDYCQENYLPEMKVVSFWKAMQNHIPNLNEREMRIVEKGKRIRVVKGIMVNGLNDMKIGQITEYDAKGNVVKRKR